MQLHSFNETDLLTDDLALRLKQILGDAVAQRGHAYMVVSGGKTPIGLFKTLAKMELPWENITLTLADERCVPLHHADRNESLVRRYLLQDHAATAHFLSLYSEEHSIRETEKMIAALPTFDAVILGMGEDGHTASLFPCADELREGLDDDAAAVLQISPKKAPYQRISLSKQRLLNSQVIYFHLIGQKKLTVLHQAMAQHEPMRMPVSAFLNNRKANVQVMYAP